MYYKIIRSKKTKIYENGDKYIGEFVNNLQNIINKIILD